MNTLRWVGLFIKITVVFAACWFASALVVPNFVERGPWRLPVTTGVAYVACLLLFATVRSVPAGRVAPSSRGGGAGRALAGAGLGAAAAYGAASWASSTDDDAPSWRSGLQGDGSIGMDDSFSSMPVINPATGLPMVGDSIGGIDVGGNLYGSSDSFSTGHSFGSDSFGSDSFGSASFGSDMSSGSSFDSW